MDLTEQMCDSPPRQADAIEISKQMIDAGVYEAREHVLGGRLEDLVQRIYVVMETERLAAAQPRQ
jgi:hypothetical protein